jgi:hypothetical protein
MIISSSVYQQKIKNHMKTYLIYLLFFLFLGLAACDQLDTTRYNSLSIEDVYETEEDVNVAVIGAYGSLSEFYRRNYPNIFELPADNATTSGEGSDLGELDKFSFVSMNGKLRAGWVNSYNCIANVNLTLENMEAVSFFKEETKEQYRGELYFIRALSYFNLVRMFGDVPLVDKTITQQEARAAIRNKASDVYNELIIRDLKKCYEELLPNNYTGQNIGRATKWAAAALLAKVYMTLGDFVQAESILNDIIESNEYSLLQNFSAIFDPNNANHAESIFEIQFEKTMTGGSFWSCAAHARSLSQEFGVSTAEETQPTQSIIDALEPNSARYNGTIGRGRNNGAYYVKKHYMELSIQNHSDDNWPLLRFADILLMYAEASNELTVAPSDRAIKYVNMVRRRAYGIDPLNETNTEHNLPSSITESQTFFREALWHERRLELAFEGHRWFDLIRTDQYVEVMNQHFQDYYNGKYYVEKYHKLFPIPQSEIDINPNLLPNNEGYN